MSRRDPLAAHIRRLGNHDLNELLVQLSKPTFAALVEVALARPVLPAGLLRYELAPGVDGWTVVACAPRRQGRPGQGDLDQGGEGRLGQLDQQLVQVMVAEAASVSGERIAAGHATTLPSGSEGRPSCSMRRSTAAGTCRSRAPRRVVGRRPERASL